MVRHGGGSTSGRNGRGEGGGSRERHVQHISFPEKGGVASEERKRAEMEANQFLSYSSQFESGEGHDCLEISGLRIMKELDLFLLLLLLLIVFFSVFER